MAYNGQTITNEVTGEILTFTQTAADTNGEKLVFDLILKPGSCVPMKHIHTTQDEIFETLEGYVDVEVGKEHKKILAGDKVLMPKSVPHKWWNSSGSNVRLTVTFIPAHNTEDFFVEMFALANSGKSKPNGAPTFSQAAVMCGKYDIYHPVIPVFLQKVASFIWRKILK